jgi:hypothetical protein
MTVSKSSILFSGTFFCSPTEPSIRNCFRLSILIVLFAQVIATQNLISFADLSRDYDPVSCVLDGFRKGETPHRLEFRVRGFIARVLVRVVLDCELTISFLDLEVRSGRCDPEGIVILCLLDHDGVGLGWFLEVDGFVRLEAKQISYVYRRLRSLVTFTAQGLVDESAQSGHFKMSHQGSPDHT